MSKEITIDIPSEYLNSGEILTIQKLSEYFIDGVHFIEPKHRIREVNHVCLVDRHKSNEKNLNSNNSNDEANQYFQMIIEVDPNYFIQEKSISIGFDRNNSKEYLLGKYFDQLYKINDKQRSTVEFKLNISHLKRCQTIFIEKDQSVSMIETNFYQQSQRKHFQRNFFGKRDHLQSRNLMEIQIEFEPEFFLDDHRLIIKRENSRSIDQHFAYRRPSKIEIDQNDLPFFYLTIDQFIVNSKYNVILLEDGQLIELSIPLNYLKTNIFQSIDKFRVHWKSQKNQIQIQIISIDDQSTIFEETIRLPDGIELDLIKYRFDEQDKSIYLILPRKKISK